jgi:aryl-alcohol dehydrogenase-like predicted oxidoreductase
MYSQRYWDEQLFDAVERLRTVADGAGLPMAELALRWTAHRDVVDSLLLGGSRAEQLQQNLQALAAGPLPADVLEACDEVGAALRGPAPAYNR